MQFEEQMLSLSAASILITHVINTSLCTELFSFSELNYQTLKVENIGRTHVT